MQRFDEENRYPEVNGSPCRVSEKTRDANPPEITLAEDMLDLRFFFLICFKMLFLPRFNIVALFIRKAFSIFWIFITKEPK